jgi:hypothetical protein
MSAPRPSPAVTCLTQHRRALGMPLAGPLPPPHHMPCPASRPAPPPRGAPRTKHPLPFTPLHRPPLASVVVPQPPPLPFPLHTVALDQRAHAPFLPSASLPRRWPNHPRPSLNSVEIIPATTAFPGSPLPQWPIMPPLPPSRQTGPCYRQKLTGQFGLRSGPRSRWVLKTITVGVVNRPLRGYFWAKLGHVSL